VSLVAMEHFVRCIGSGRTVSCFRLVNRTMSPSYLPFYSVNSPLSVMQSPDTISLACSFENVLNFKRVFAYPPWTTKHAANQ